MASGSESRGSLALILRACAATGKRTDQVVKFSMLRRRICCQLCTRSWIQTKRALSPPPPVVIVPELTGYASIRYIAVSLPRIDALVADPPAKYVLGTEPGRPTDRGTHDRSKPGAIAAATAQGPQAPRRGPVHRKAVGLADQGNAASTAVKKVAQSEETGTGAEKPEVYRFAAVPSDLTPGIRSGPVVPWHSVLWYSPTMITYPQKITFGELRASGVRDLLVYCRDHRCSHHTAAITSRSAPTMARSCAAVGHRTGFCLHRLRHWHFRMRVWALVRCRGPRGSSIQSYRVGSRC